MLSAFKREGEQPIVLSGPRLSQQSLVLIFNQFPVKRTRTKEFNISETTKPVTVFKSSRTDVNKDFFTLPQCWNRAWAVYGAWQHHCWQEQVSITLLQTILSQTSAVPWARVMASLHWAALCYCRITERLIETNDSNNGTLSPQAGFVVGLISVAVVARRTSHHADPSKEAAEAPF